MSFVLGYDAGTHGVRALVYDTEQEAIIASAKADYQRITAPGIQELQPEELWRAFCEVTTQLQNTLPIGARAKGLAITHQRGTVIPVDEFMRPLANAMCDSDERALSAEELKDYGVDASGYYHQTGCPFVSFNGVSKILWCHKKEPELYAKTKAWLSPQDYIASRLCGQLVQSAGSALRNGIYNIKGRHLAQLIFPTLGKNQPNADLPCIEPGKPMGVVVTNELPLLQGATVVAAPGDQPAALLGCGAIGSDKIAINLGTTFVASIAVDTPAFDPEELVTTEVLPENCYAPEFGTGAGGQFMDWFSTLLLGRMPTEAKEWAALDVMAKGAPAGAQGLLAVPLLWQVTSANVQGRFLNLASFHTQHHLMRAVYEGLAYEARLSVERLERVCAKTADIVRVFGGMCENSSFLSIMASVLGKPVQVAWQKQASACGALLCAAYAMGHFNTLDEVSEWANQIRVTYMPDNKEATYYDDKFKEYRTVR